MVARRSLRHIALAGVVGLSMIGLAGVAGAQESESAAPVDPAAAVQPVEPEAVAPEAVESTTVPPPATSIELPSVTWTGTTTPGATTTQQPPATETSTTEQPPADGPEPITAYDVSLQTDCYDDGYGMVFVHVRSSDTESRGLTATVEGETKTLEFVYDEELELGMYQTFFEDVAAGSVPVRVAGPGVDVTVRANLEGCVPDRPAPDDEFLVTVSCVDGDGVITIQVYVPGESERSYTITVDDFVLEPYFEYPFFGGVIAKITEVAPNGTYMIGLYDGERLIDEQEITVDCPDTTPTATPTATTPPAQGGPVPGDDGGLANTGAAVGGIAALGALALALGAALVLSGRRRAARAGSTD